MVSYHYVKYQKKLMTQSWENLVTDGRTDAQRDKQTVESDFIGRCPTDVERPIVTYETRKHNWNPGSILQNLINLKNAIIE